MADSGKGGAARPSAEGGKASPEAGAAGDRSFDSWLKTQLDEFYGEIVDEPVPEAMLDLIRRHKGEKG